MRVGKNYLFLIFFSFLFLSLVARGKEITISHLSDFIFNPVNKIESIENLLPKLPEDLRKNYILMIESKSLQEGTADNPRVIMFGKAGDIFVAFNGGVGRNSYGGNTLEVIEQVGKTHAYNFTQFTFGNEKPSVSFRSNRYVSEVRNAKACLNCHGLNHGRVIWELYPEWPGALPASFKSSRKDRDYLNNFIVSGAQHPRYKALFREENLKRMLEIRPETSMASQLDDILHPIRMDRFHEFLSHTPDFEKLRYAFIGAISNCPNLETFLPKTTQDQFNRFGDRKKLGLDLAAVMPRLAPRHSLFSFGTTPEIVGSLRWLLESRQIDMSDWGTSFQSPYLLATTPEIFFPKIATRLGAKVGLPVPEKTIFDLLPNRLGQVGLVTGEDKAIFKSFCENLQKTSLQTLGENL